MKQFLIVGWLLGAGPGLLLAATPDPKSADPLAAWNVVWDSPSANAHASMPLGNGDVGINAWVEANGDLVFYLSKTDAWDENARLCKIGRVRVQFEPALTVSNGFRQELKLRDGVIEITANIQNQPAKILLWVDAQAPVVRVETESAQPLTCRATVELWRLRERPFGPDDDSHSGGGLAGSAFKPTVLPDVVLPAEKSRVAWYHRNTRSIYKLGLEVQQLASLQDRFPDPLLNHTFGASLAGEGFVRDGDRTVRSLTPSRRHQLSVCVLAERAATPEAWLKDLAGIERRAAANKKSRQVTAQWWRDFWARSWVFLDGPAETSILTRGYILQRFMTACSGRGAAPVKFNGSIFNVESQPGASAQTPAGDPDWRRWGGSFWFQNTRHQYWPMPETGDFDMMRPFFTMYLNALPLGQARVKTYYQFDNAVVFPETMHFWGLPNNNDYGWQNKAPEPGNAFIKRYWSGNLEVTALMLEYYEFTQDKEFARTTLVPLAGSIVSFFDQYWQKRDAKGLRVFEPAQSLETYHVAVNPLPEIAGLNLALPRLLALPEGVATQAQRARWKRFLAELPPMPVAGGTGEDVFRPAATFGGKSNFENPELYCVFPFKLYGVGRDLLEVARRTFARRIHHLNKCWCQDSIQAACLGMPDEAAKLVVARASQGTGDYRFPATWLSNNDWVPDVDHGSPILTTLNAMLLQYSGDKIYLFPAWPKTWNVSFKLHAPKNTVVEAELRNGKMVSLEVTPKSRAADVVNMMEK